MAAPHGAQLKAVEPEVQVTERGRIEVPVLEHEGGVQVDGGEVVHGATCHLRNRGEGGLVPS